MDAKQAESLILKYREKEPVFADVMSVAKDRSEAIAVENGGETLDLAFKNNIEDTGLPNRARIKFFYPGESKGKMAVFFYKSSLLPYSRDRFGYGGEVFAPKAIDSERIKGWFEFAASGFHIEKRPTKWMRGFPYDVPGK